VANTLTTFPVRLFRAVAAGTSVALLISLFRPFLKSAGHAVELYVKLRLPTYALTQACLVLLFLLLVALLKKLPWKIWRSLKLGLIPFHDWIWLVSVVFFWLALELRHTLLAWGSMGLAVLLTAAGWLIIRRTTQANRSQSARV
jgi:hypothetical protein